MNLFLRAFVALILVSGLVTACSPGPSVNDAPPAVVSDAPDAAPTAPPKPAAAPQPAQDPNAIRVEVPGQGTLVVAPPAGSSLDQTTTKMIGQQEAVVARINIPGDITLQATILGPADLYPGFGSDRSLQDRLTEWRDAIEPQLLEGPRAIEPFPGESPHGFYTLATIDTPDPTAKNYVLNGYYLVGNHVVMIGGNHDDDSKMADERILEVIRTVRWEDSPS
jgi:hypothetical protein